MELSTQEKQAIDSRIYAGIISRGVSPLLAKIAVAQARNESGHYTSKRFAVNKNAFGYTYNPSSPWQSGIGGKQPEANSGYYANYANYLDSGKEIGDYLMRRADKLKDVTTPAQYAAVLKKENYFSAPLADYSRIITNIYNNQLKHLTTGAAANMATLAKKKPWWQVWS